MAVSQQLSDDDRYVRLYAYKLVQLAQKMATQLTDAWWPIDQYGEPELLAELGVSVAELVVLCDRIALQADVVSARVDLGLTHAEAVAHAAGRTRPPLAVQQARACLWPTGRPSTSGAPSAATPREQPQAPPTWLRRPERPPQRP